MKDILFDVNACDVLFRDLNEGVELYETVWGPLFPGDSELYLNVIVPYVDVNNLPYSDDGDWSIFFHAEYMPVCEPFTIRLVVGDSSEVGYSLISTVRPGMQSEYPAFARLSFDGKLKEIEASMLPVINIDGDFQLRIVRYYSRRIVEIYSMALTDFAIGDSDDQSAQLLSICGPGKYYRYPTTGVDVTKYVNSVVSHTDVGEATLSQFNADERYVHEADFDSKNGNLTVAFSGDNEDADNGNVPVEELDLSVLKMADDEFIRQNVFGNEVEGNSDVIIAIPDVNSVRSIINLNYSDGEDLTGTNETGYYFDENGDKSQNVDYVIVTAELHEGDLLQFNLPNNLDLSGAVFFKLLDDDNEVIYMTSPDENYNPGANAGGNPYLSYNNAFDRCAIILQDCTIKYAMRQNAIALNQYWIRRKALSESDLTKLIIYAINTRSGVNAGHLIKDSLIKDAVIMPKTGEIILNVEE